MNAPNPEADAGEAWEGLDDAAEPTRIDGMVRLGRFELVWELGSGGMASVYLARLRGPGGFHRWFAIKRIHANLAKDPRFVQMFFDEARIAAAVQHPNVSTVFEVGEDRGEPYLAMEYLHGEHLGALAARAARQSGALDAAIAARLVALAAEGLHHAHEAKDEAGAPLGLVHRDVSPQNIFVTYDGEVKLTDFGIAKAAGRLTHTQTGGLKGKVSYMAPEQALGQPMDRRSDVWALGVVLWECTTGRRLFRASTDAQTLLRITSGQVTPPSRVRAGYPPELEQIVMKALAPAPDDRWPSALEFARALDRWIASTGTEVGARTIATVARQLFADRIELKDAILRGELPGGIATPAIAREGEQSSSRIVARATTTSARRTARAALVTATIVALVAAGAAAVWWATRRVEAVVRIDTSPPGAVVYLDGERQPGTTPLLLERVPAGEHAVRIEREGHEPYLARFPSSDGRMNLAYDLRPAGSVAADPASGTGTGTGTGTGAATAPARDEVGATDTATATATDTAPATDTDTDTATATATGAEAETETEAEAQTETETETVPRTRRNTGPRVAYLNLITRPWARVSLRGRDLGNTPLLRRPIPSGAVVLRLRAQGTGPARTLRITSEPGEIVSRSIDLE